MRHRIRIQCGLQKGIYFQPYLFLTVMDGILAFAHSFLFLLLLFGCWQLLWRVGEADCLFAGVLVLLFYELPMQAHLITAKLQFFGVNCTNVQHCTNSLYFNSAKRANCLRFLLFVICF